MNRPFERHWDDAALELYALNRLDEASTGTLEEHLLICEGCRVRLDETDRYLIAMKTAAARLRQEPQHASSSIVKTIRDWFIFQPLPAWAGAAAAVCVLGLISTIYMRNVIPANDSLYAVSMTAARGAEQNPAPSGRRLDLKLDTRGLDLSTVKKVELVDSTGAVIQTGSAGEASDFRPNRALGAGEYFVRIYGSSADPLREYGLSVH